MDFIPILHAKTTNPMMQESYVQMVKDSLGGNPDRTAFANYEGGSYTFAEVATHIYHLHRFYENCGIQKGDKIALYGRNSSNWAISYLSVITYGAVVVPILPNFMPNEVHHLMNHSESVIMFASQNIWEPLEASKMYNLKTAISLEDFSALYTAGETEARAIRHFNETRQTPPATAVDFDTPPNDTLFAIIYTSGTTGFSKGVMLTHNNITANIVYARTHMPLVPGDRILSFLPLAHAYGCAIEFLYPFTLGCHITFLGKTPTPQLLIKAFGEIRPRLILSVPLIIEKIYRKQVKPIISQPKMKLILGVPIVDKLILKKINQKLMNVFGGNFHELVIGGAALNEEVQLFLRKIKFPFTIGYGMTECGPLISYAPWNQARLNSAGRVVDTLEMKTDSQNPATEVGEILVRGENVMTGYYKNEEATREAIDDDGWLHTGDLGTIDADGFLYIKGRSKSMILGASGQNIYPEEIESLINNWPYVNESLVVERKNALVALIYPDFEAADKDKISEHEVPQLFDTYRQEMNKGLASYMGISRIEIFPHEFEKTPKRSIKRFLYS